MADRTASTGTEQRFPDQTFGSEGYWVDIVFVTSIGPDTTPPPRDDHRAAERFVGCVANRCRDRDF